MRRSNNRLIVNLSSLLINDSIRIIINLETVEMTIVIVIEAEIVTARLIQ